MTTLFSYLLTFLGVIFWAFRAIATLLYQMEVDFFAVPLNETIEIIGNRPFFYFENGKVEKINLNNYTNSKKLNIFN